MRLPKCRTPWLSAVLLAVVVSVAWLFVPRSRITQTNFDRIHEGMTFRDVASILGAEDPNQTATLTRNPCLPPISGPFWRDGPNWILVLFDENRLCCQKQVHLATAPETLIWYAQKAGAKIGVNWD
jgi:hypothetical protein